MRWSVSWRSLRQILNRIRNMRHAVRQCATPYFSLCKASVNLLKTPPYRYRIAREYHWPGTMVSLFMMIT